MVISERAEQYAFKLMTAASNTCKHETAIEQLDVDVFPDDLVLWEPFENMSARQVLQVYDLLVDSFIDFAVKTRLLKDEV